MTTENRSSDQKNQNQNQNQNQRKRGFRSRRRNRDSDEISLIENVIKIRRVSKTVKGGRNLSFNAILHHFTLHCQIDSSK